MSTSTFKWTRSSLVCPGDSNWARAQGSSHDDISACWQFRLLSCWPTTTTTHTKRFTSETSAKISLFGDMSQQLQPLPPLMGGTPEQQPDLSVTSSYYPQEPNDLTGGLPINLDSLRDGPPGSKPFYPYSTLIRYVFDLCMILLRELNRFAVRYAIKGSPNQKLLLEDIYYAIESRVRICHCCYIASF